MTKHTSIPQNDNELIALTKQALTDILDREPTQQEILRAHAGFKRMAFVMMEHIDHQNKEEKRQKSKMA